MFLPVEETARGRCLLFDLSIFGKMTKKIGHESRVFQNSIVKFHYFFKNNEYFAKKVYRFEGLYVIIFSLRLRRKPSG